MAKSSKWITAKEFLKQLESDPEYMRRRAEQDRAFAELEARLKAAEMPLVRDLAKIGIEVESVYDLVNTASSYDKAIPVLLDHLRRPYPDAIREGIARALAVRATKQIGWQILIDEYCSTDLAHPRVKDGLAIALSEASDDSVIPLLIDLAKDKRHGDSRILLLLGIKRSRLPKAKQAITELSDDPVFAKEIRSWGRRRK
jgi:hypothetical protein